MIYKHFKINNHLSFIYGFAKEKQRYDLTVTLFSKFKTTEIHALLSQVKLTPKDFVDLWNFIRKYSRKYILFEVIPQDALVYKRVLPILEVKKSKTFDGYESETLICNKKEKVRI